MEKLRDIGIFAFVATGALLFQTGTAEPCQPPACWGAYFYPVQGGEVPANLPAVDVSPRLYSWGRGEDLDGGSSRNRTSVSESGGCER